MTSGGLIYVHVRLSLVVVGVKIKAPIMRHAAFTDPKLAPTGTFVRSETLLKTAAASCVGVLEKQK